VLEPFIQAEPLFNSQSLIKCEYFKTYATFVKIILFVEHEIWWPLKTYTWLPFDDSN